MLYDQTLDALESQAAKRKFLRKVGDVQGERLLDAGAFKNESDLSTGGIHG